MNTSATTVHRSAGVSLIGAMIFTAAVGVLAAVLIPILTRADTSQEVSIRVDRSTTFGCSLCGADLFVNGIKIGSVSNGHTEIFHFSPATDGKNSVRVRLMTGLGPNSDSPAVDFIAHAGGSVYARIEVDNWVVKMSPEVKLEVAVERVGTVNPTSSPRPPNMDNRLPEGVTRITGLSWDAIGAIAGVVGAVAGIACAIVGALALWKE